MEGTGSRRGFSLVELTVTLVILAILAALAVPAWINYTRRAYFYGIVQMTEPYRTAVETCTRKLHAFTRCNAGRYHIPPALMVAKDGIASLTVQAGVITVIPVPANGVTAMDTLVLTPTLGADGTVNWTRTGGAVNQGYTP